LRLELSRRTIGLVDPMETSYGSVSSRDVILVSLTGSDGVVGHGEAAPLQPYDGVSIERAERALASYVGVIGREGDAGGAALLDACRRADDLPAALAAIDMALWDMAGRRAGRTVAGLITDSPAAEIPVNATIGSLARSQAAQAAERAVAAGFTCIKLKVGAGDDAGRVAAVRAAAGPGTALRLDANGAWSVEEAVRWIDVLSPAGLELVEEPTHGIAAMREVRERVAVRVAIDETAAEPGALAAGVADAVCLKISRCGGIGRLLAAAALVRSMGAEVYLASTLDGPLGIAAAVHAAAALSSRGAMPHCGLATLPMMDGVGDPLPVRAGSIALPSGPGLGVDPF